MDWLSWVIGALVVVVVAGWAVYLAGIQRLPASERPKILKLDRFGAPIERSEPPDFHIMAGEGPAEDG